MAGRWKGCGASHSESLAIAGDVPLKFSRRQCDTCNAETLWRGLKCLTCGTLKAKVVRPLYGGFATERAMSGLKAQQHRRQFVQDRIAAAKRRAEESRKKFEGGK